MNQNRVWVNRRLTKSSWRRWSWSVLFSPHFDVAWYAPNWTASLKIILILLAQVPTGFTTATEMHLKRSQIIQVLIGKQIIWTYWSCICAWNPIQLFELDNHWIKRAGQAAEWWFWDWLHHRAIWRVPHRSLKASWLVGALNEGICNDGQRKNISWHLFFLLISQPSSIY